MRSVLVAAVVLLAAAGAAGAVVTSDPSDAPSGAQGKTDLRTLTWSVGASTTTLTVKVNESTYGGSNRAELGLHVLLDTDRDGLADAEVTGVRNGDGVSIDLAVRTLARTLSTATCQDLDGTLTAAQATITSAIAGGLETFSFTFANSVVPGGLSHFRWAAFGQSPPAASSAGPWDYAPNAANPDAAPANPGDRRCDASLSGLRVNMAAGIDLAQPVAQTKFFHSPSGNIQCELVSNEGGRNYARCQATHQPRSAKLGLNGKTKVCAGVSCLGDGPEHSFTLGYGKTTRLTRFRCKSLRTGMRCVVISSSHGFKISRTGVTRF
jgi:hypothetical protein